MMSSGYTSLDNQKVSGSVPSVSDPGHVAVKFTDSSLQTLPPSETQGKMSNNFRPPRDADDTFSKPAHGGGGGGRGGGGNSDENQQVTVAFFKPVINIDTADVDVRLKDSFF